MPWLTQIKLDHGNGGTPMLSVQFLNQFLSFREIFIVRCAGQIVTITTVLCSLTLLANLQLIKQ